MTTKCTCYETPSFSSRAPVTKRTLASGESQGHPFNGQTPLSTRGSVCKWANKHSVGKQPLLFGPARGGLVLLTSGGPWAQTHSNHLTGPWESKATARLANTPVDRAIPNNSISGPVIYSRSLVPPLLKTADISPKQGLTTFCLHRPLYLLSWIFMNVLRGQSR